MKPHTAHHDDCGCRSARYEATIAELVNELEYAAEIIEQECGESSSSATRARAAIAKAKEQSK